MDHLSFAALLGNYGEFVGALGVIVSLFYVGHQIRQNTRATRASSVLATRQMAIEFHHMVTRPDMAEIYTRGLADYPNLAEEDRVRFQSLMNTLFNYNEALYYDRVDVARKELTKQEAANVRYHLRQPGVRRYWNQMGTLHGPEFVRWVNKVAPAEDAEPE